MSQFAWARRYRRQAASVAAVCAACFAAALLLSCNGDPIPEQTPTPVTPAATPTPIPSPTPTLPANLSIDPLPEAIQQTEGIIEVAITDFARLPESGDPESSDARDHGPALMMLLVDEPGTCRLFVNDFRGPLHSVSYDSRRVELYVDVGDPKWNLELDFKSSGRDYGFGSFAFHPQFNQPGTPGFGKFYTILETSNKTPEPDFIPWNQTHDHFDTVLLEWTAIDPAASVYDGGPPRELIRIQQPHKYHNGGQISFNPLAAPGDPDFGKLYVSTGDGGFSGDPYGHSLNLSYIFGKILRIDPLGSDSANGRYGVPEDNPFVGKPGRLGEIYAYGMRNPQRFGWDSRTGDLLVTDVGQDVIEEISIAVPGANLGWNRWEGSFRLHPRRIAAGHYPVDLDHPRGDPGVTYPIVEFDHKDTVFKAAVAITGIVVYREDAIPELKDKLLFGDIVSGEVFYVQVDEPLDGGQGKIRRVLFNHEGETKTLLQLVQESRHRQGLSEIPRADLRFGVGPDGQVFLLNKRDGVIRRLGGAPNSTCPSP